MSLSRPFELLIKGLSNRIWIPHDIKQLIKKYCTANHWLHMYSYLLYNNGRNLYNIFNNSNHTTICAQFSTEKTILGQCIANNVKLPNVIGLKLKLKSQDILSSHWSMIFDKSYISLLRRDLHDTLSFNMYRFALPTFPVHMDLQPAMVYNKTNNILYAMNITSDFYWETNCLYSLNFNYIKTKHWKWKWNKLYNKLYKRFNTSACMVDNDRFIAILGGKITDKNYATSQAELYALNCNQSIPLKNMNRCHGDLKSVYHDKFHKIIVLDKNHKSKLMAMEIYDINKDEWTIFSQKLSNPGNTEKKYAYKVFAKQMIVSQDNPNILFVACSGSNDSEWEWSRNRRNQTIYELHQIDLRTDGYNFSTIESIDFVSQHSLFLHL